MSTEKEELKKGTWSPGEDQKLIAYIKTHGITNWSLTPKVAGLSRTGKSCRLRWVNYLQPDLKRGPLAKDEVETIIKLHASLGNRWKEISKQLPGRTDNEIKNFWHTHVRKRRTTTAGVGGETPRKLADRKNKRREKSASHKPPPRDRFSISYAVEGTMNSSENCSSSSSSSMTDYQSTDDHHEFPIAESYSPGDAVDYEIINTATESHPSSSSAEDNIVVNSGSRSSDQMFGEIHDEGFYGETDFPVLLDDVCMPEIDYYSSSVAMIDDEHIQHIINSNNDDAGLISNFWFP